MKKYDIVLAKDMCIQQNDELMHYFIEKIQVMIEVEAKKGLMVEHSDAEIEKAIMSGNALVATVDASIIGYVSLISWKNYTEVGALIVDNAFRNQGIGKALFKSVVSLAKDKYQEKRVIVLANDISFAISKKYGFVEKSKNWLDDEVWQLCTGCEEENSFPVCHCRVMVY